MKTRAKKRHITVMEGVVVTPSDITPQLMRKRTIELRHAHALAKLKRAKTRVKLAQTILKKWQRKVKYYERLQS